ncbi:nucleic-acid-binding protein from transposon X-element [Trichonephila clavipes]|nr:nucleic-acid-binding protein from transposon X-element [Trichonephila clavipes]
MAKLGISSNDQLTGDGKMSRQGHFPDEISKIVIRSARILRSAARTANATGPRCLGNPHLVSPSIRASDFCSLYQGFIDKEDSTYSLPFSGNGKDSDMANLPTDMELEQASTQRTLSRTPSSQPQLTPCEQLKFNKAQLAKMEAFRKSLTELQDIEETMAIAVSDIDSYDPCTIPGCPHHEKTPPNSPIKFTQTTPKNTPEERLALQLLKKLKFQFYTIRAKADCPIKVVIKGLPGTTKPEEIKEDLELLGYTPERVNQLFRRKTKRALPIFLITLTRNLDNLKIFDLKTLSYLSIRVEGYNGKGVTQCYTCNNFNHTSENCHLNPRCLKCGENHLARDCPIKQKFETAYCINCHIYGHMANYKGCPSFPKSQICAKQ